MTNLPTIRWYPPTLGALVALGLIAPAASAQSIEIPPIPIDTFTLDNGLYVIVSPDHSTPLVSVQVWYDVGSAHEAEGRSGFAHLFEHMLFEETEHLADDEISQLVQQAGGNYNGTTNTDRTAYYENLPSNRVNLSFWLHAERMARLVVSEENFERQREVVKEERRLRVDNQPYQNAGLTLDTLMTDYLPYRHTIIGSMADLDAATLEDVRSFYRQHYVPNNATLTVVGDVTTAQIRALAEEYFGDIPRGATPTPLPPASATPRTDGERRAEVPDPLAQLPLMWMAWNTPPANHPDQDALQILAQILSTGESSRLYRRLVNQEQAALAFIAQPDTRLGPGSFRMGALPNQGVELSRLEGLIEEEIQKVIQDGVTDREIEKALNQQRAGAIASRLTAQGKAQMLQSYRLFYGSPFEVNRDIERMEAVTADEVRRVARTYLVTENRTVVIAVPSRPAGE